MMSVQVNQEQLDVLVEISRRMRQSATEADWEAVSHLQQQSQQLAGELFARVIPAADVQAVTKAVSEVLEINKYVADIGMNARDLCLEEIDQLQQGRKAVKEYTANTE